MPEKSQHQISPKAIKQDGVDHKSIHNRVKKTCHCEKKNTAWGNHISSLKNTKYISVCVKSGIVLNV